uniref:ORF64a n=1 Tax=Pinus thunbergii TaxID=3350 RepID=Q32956_PINTH|nr:ORF64a [Pinus thunbergii]BAA04372.1 ORF64a [Pinus thunbergii]
MGTLDQSRHISILDRSRLIRYQMIKPINYFYFFFIASSSKNSRVLSNIICSKQSIEQSKYRSDM